MRILVTGGAGFIGSHLCRQLVSQGNEVICVDNFHTGRVENIKELLPNPAFRLLRHDVQMALSEQVDEIFHLACPASPVHYQSDPIWTLKTAVFGTLNVLDLAKATGARVLIASTSEVYGNPLIHPQREEYWGNVNPVGVRSCYDEGKRAAETLASDFRRMYGTDARIVRIFNTYGPNMCPDDGRVVSNFIVQALQNRPLTIYGDGSQTRSFCFVDDLVQALERTMNLPENPGVLNLGNPKEFTVKELAELILNLVDSQSDVVYKSLPPDDPERRRPDISRACALLDWEPVTELRTGLIKTIAYFQATMARTAQGPCYSQHGISQIAQAKG